MSSSRIARLVTFNGARPARRALRPVPSFIIRQARTFSKSSNPAMATETITPEDVSQVAKEEGGTFKGSTSAQMQSEMTKQRQTGGERTNRQDSLPQDGPITPQKISEVAQMEGGPSKGSLSAQMQSELTKQRDATGNNTNRQSVSAQDVTSGPITPEKISQVAQMEGGTTKGSMSAQMQSEMAKQRNNASDQTAFNNNAPRNVDNGPITPEKISQVAQMEGGTTKGSMSAQMQSEMTKQRNAPGNTTSQQNTVPQEVVDGPITPEKISQVAHMEGGTSKGSLSAQMQSQMTKERNDSQGATNIGNLQSSTSATAGSRNQSQPAREREFEHAAQEIGSKMQTDPASVTQADASYLESRASRAMGGSRPPKDSIAADAQRLAAANAKENGRA